MKDIVNVYSKYGREIGFICIALVILMPINMMRDFVLNDYRFNAFEAFAHIWNSGIAIVFASELKKGNKEGIDEKMGIYTLLAILESIIFICDSLTTIIMIMKKY